MVTRVQYRATSREIRGRGSGDGKTFSDDITNFLDFIHRLACLIVVYLTTLFSDYTASNEREINELEIVKDLEGSGSGLI
jgi:hypothetical protein